MPPLRIRPAGPADAGAIARIYDAAIAGGWSTFATGPHSAEERRGWLAARGDRAPVFVAEGGEAVLGWAALAPFSHRAWYDGVAEYTVYVAEEARGRGVGRAMLRHLVSAAPGLGYWKLVGLIFPENAAGLALARGHGFRVVGTHLAHSRMAGEWRDITVVERHLEVPAG
ncbi:MAG: N-acetyltransferase family protein [Thermoleophilia bacterium]|nr:N-acetyltransferase family protein [Thermoleophilia bacterium]